MKKTFILSVFFLNQLIVYSQTPSIQWQKCFGGTNAESISSIVEVSDGFILVGYTSSTDGDVTS